MEGQVQYRHRTYQYISEGKTSIVNEVRRRLKWFLAFDFTDFSDKITIL